MQTLSASQIQQQIQQKHHVHTPGNNAPFTNSNIDAVDVAPTSSVTVKVISATPAPLGVTTTDIMSPATASAVASFATTLVSFDMAVTLRGAVPSAVMTMIVRGLEIVVVAIAGLTEIVGRAVHAATHATRRTHTHAHTHRELRK